MILYEKWLVLEDGCVMNMDTGRIFWPVKNYAGLKCFRLMDEKGKVHFWLQRNLLKKLREYNANKRIQASSETEGDY